MCWFSIHHGILVLIRFGILLGDLGIVSLANLVHYAFLTRFVFACLQHCSRISGEENYHVVCNDQLDALPFTHKMRHDAH